MDGWMDGWMDGCIIERDIYRYMYMVGRETICIYIYVYGRDIHLYIYYIYCVETYIIDA